MKSIRRKTSLVPGGGPLFQRMFTRLGCDGRPPRFRVEFYPYSSLVLTGALVEPYLQYARSDRTRSRMNRMRRGRVRLAATGPRGDHFDLDRLFDELNGRYFEGKLQRPHIGWSTRSWRRQFGCYDPGPNQILLNRRMDRPEVPACAVEYVLFHEMLHVKHPTRRSGCTMVSHSREFREEEKRFAEFERARRILDRLAR
jgi:hypothetical protein